MLGNNLTFIDSFQFMSSCLDNLVNNLPKDDLKYTSQVFKGKKLNLMSQKGVYPYDFMDSFEKFDQTELPTKDQFYSILNDQHITDDEYDHAKKVWKAFKIKTMGEYHDLYLGSDVLFSLMCSKASERHAYNTTNWIHVIISQVRVLVGMLC